MTQTYHQRVLTFKSLIELSFLHESQAQDFCFSKGGWFRIFFRCRHLKS